jgi:hypothetical protein
MRAEFAVRLTDAPLGTWRALPSDTPGGRRTYSDLAIEAALTIRLG